MGSLVADVVLDGVDAGVELDGVLLHGDFLLDERVDLLLEEVALVDVVRLQLLVVLLQVGDVLDDLLQDVVRRLSRVVLQGGALGAKELHFLLVVVQKLDRLLRVPLIESRFHSVSNGCGRAPVVGGMFDLHRGR